MYAAAKVCGLVSLAALAEGFSVSLGASSLRSPARAVSAVATRPALGLRMQTGGKGLKGVENGELPNEEEYFKGLAARKRSFDAGESKVLPSSEAFDLVYEDEGEMFSTGGQGGMSDRAAARMRVGNGQGLSISMDDDEEGDEELERALLAMFVQQGDAPEGALKMMEDDNFEGIDVVTTREGDGKTFPKKGDILTVEYEGRLQDGNVFDASNGSPLKFAVGRGQVIAGWDAALMGMSLGEAVTVKIGPDMAYADKGFGTIIPPWSCLTFDMTLLAIDGEKGL